MLHISSRPYCPGPDKTGEQGLYPGMGCRVNTKKEKLTLLFLFFLICFSGPCMFYKDYAQGALLECTPIRLDATAIKNETYVTLKSTECSHAIFMIRIFHFGENSTTHPYSVMIRYVVQTRI